MVRGCLQWCFTSANGPDQDGVEELGNEGSRESARVWERGNERVRSRWWFERAKHQWWSERAKRQWSGFNLREQSIVMANFKGESNSREMYENSYEEDDNRGSMDDAMRGLNDPNWDLWEEWMGLEGAGICAYSSHINSYKYGYCCSMY
ncbi:chaperone protein dnaJ 8, chloroplastic-like [Senna tora]|uniref:Chaperone protein dnaJ 8, chloroplastic-like n=1 Tax=Senna tora TaxID=362788 RepID=A0A834TSV1_9FABA|nr:chaperone protein dnaJ 8, chloroplastic-like [Senna tora]